MHVLRTNGYQFLETGKELIALYTRDVMEDEVVISLNRVEDVGKALHEAYVQARVGKATVPISNTIPRNAMYTFANRPTPGSKKDEKLGVRKNNSILVTQLFRISWHLS